MNTWTLLLLLLVETVCSYPEFLRQEDPGDEEMDVAKDTQRDLLLTTFFNNPYREDDVLGQGYAQKTAAEKHDLLLSMLRETEGFSSAAYPNFWENLWFAVFEDKSPTITTFSDLSPYRHPKRIHARANVAAAKFVAVDNPYTGLFQGSDYMFLRIGSGAPAGTTFSVPGVGVKFLRSGQPSANFVAMKDLLGQEGRNLFLFEWSNHFPDPEPFLARLVQVGFTLASNPSSKVGLSDIASMTQDGAPVADPKFPFQLFLVPNPDLTAQFADIPFSDDYYTAQLSMIPVGTTLWNVFAVDAPDSNTRIPLGSIVLTEEFFVSDNGDLKLFFRHQKFAEDLARRPDWDIEFPQFRRQLLSEKKCPLLTRRSSTSSSSEEDK